MGSADGVETPRQPPGWLNGAMVRVLRSPFSRVLDRGIALLTVVGRRTGRRYTFPVQYVQDGQVLWIVSGARDAKTWWRNLVGGARVEVLLRRRLRRARGEAFTPEADPRAVEQGVRMYVRRFPRTAKRLGVSPGDSTALARFAERTSVVRLRLDDDVPA
jgi:deazaflavin-dependent oxidoreductase (nitroreductase family)